MLQEEHMPKETHLGKFVFAQKGGVDVTPVRVRKVFENSRLLAHLFLKKNSWITKGRIPKYKKRIFRYI